MGCDSIFQWYHKFPDCNLAWQVAGQVLTT